MWNIFIQQEDRIVKLFRAWVSELKRLEFEPQPITCSTGLNLCNLQHLVEPQFPHLKMDMAIPNSLDVAARAN